MRTAAALTSYAAGLAVAASLLAAPPTAAQESDSARRTEWFVRAGATPGDGSRAHPFGSLTRVEQASAPGDRIVVLRSRMVLDGGIALQPGQSLVGAGPSVRGLTDGPAPVLTNSTDHLDGDAVRLADRTTVRNLRIVDARRGAVYGRDVDQVRVLGNDVSGQNASCAPGFLIPEFMAPTNFPGVGIPISGGLQNGWAGIMLDAGTRQGLKAHIAGNLVHDAECGDGIDVRTWGHSRMTVRIEGNVVESLRQGPGFKSVLAIGLQAADSSRLRASLDDNIQADLGNPDELNFAVEGADSEGVFVNGVGPSWLHATVTGNRYTNDDGVGGFSANGLEMVTMGAGSRVTTIVRDSHFSGSPGDVIEEGALGTDATLRMVLDNVVAERSSGIGNTVVLPFNNGDCLLAGSLGARNVVELVVRDSVLRNCSNNGLSVGSNVVNGRGPTTRISVDVDRTTITGNRGGNLAIRNFTALDTLHVRVQRSDLGGSRGLGSTISDLSAEDLGQTTTSVIDLGGGGFDGVGGNCLRGGLFAADVVRYAVSARRSWWGRPGGPGPLRTFELGGSLDTAEPLGTSPAYCG